MRLRWKETVAVTSILMCGACSNPPQAPASATVFRPARAIHLRAAFDNDPTVYVGRMVPPDVDPAGLDETTAKQTRCGQFVTTKLVDTDQEMDEYVYTSTQASASLGYRAIASVSAGTSSGGVLRVHYKLAKKLQSQVSDMGKFAQCCAATRSCTAQMVGTFLMGSGDVYEETSTQDQVGLSGTTPQGVTAGIDYKDGAGWKRVNSFHDTYFAFLVEPVDNAIPVPDDQTCGWCDSLPSSMDGSYFCGVSPNSVEEVSARDMAMQNAREQVIKFLGEYLSTQSSSTSSVLKGYLDDSHVVSAATSGIASQVKDVKWCAPERTDAPNGRLYKSKVLAFLPETSRAMAARATIEAIIRSRKSDSKLSPDEEKDLRAMLDSIK
jgi:hypothetical protein